MGREGRLTQGRRRPKRDHAQYGLRCIGGRLIYLFDETQGDVFVWRVNEENGQFIELQSRHRSLEGALKKSKRFN